MPLYAHLDPKGFAYDGGDVGVLLLHGLTGAPTEMRGLGDHLQGLGLTVRAPLLAGHGTHHSDLEKSTRADWIDSARVHLREMRSSLRKVFIVGQSMGGLLALTLGAGDSNNEGGDVDGIVALAPALLVTRFAWFTHLPLPRFFPKYEERRPDLVDAAQLKEVWSYSHTPRDTVREILRLQADVRAQLPRFARPLLVMQGRRDRTVRPVSASLIVDSVGSVDKELVWLENTGHIVSVDRERHDVFARVAAFIAARQDR
ncbi:MAG: alpha/beta fold hydrolase [Deltaproteobacteria bacterium]|nr:alpha/beta fold hydrolase [Deltaproteobacteria bacterium]